MALFVRPNVVSRRLIKGNSDAVADESVRFQGCLILNCCDQTLPGMFTD
jgi:hypothetical protein